MDVSEKLTKSFEQAEQRHEAGLRQNEAKQERVRQDNERKAKIQEPIDRALSLANQHANFRIPLNMNDAYTRDYYSEWVDVEPFEDRGVVQAKLNRVVRVERIGLVETGTSPFIVTVDLRIRGADAQYTSREDEAVAIFCADGWVKLENSKEAIFPESPEWEKMLEFLGTIETAFSSATS